MTQEEVDVTTDSLQPLLDLRADLRSELSVEVPGAAARPSVGGHARAKPAGTARASTIAERVVHERVRVVERDVATENPAMVLVGSILKAASAPLPDLGAHGGPAVEQPEVQEATDDTSTTRPRRSRKKSGDD